MLRRIAFFAGSAALAACGGAQMPVGAVPAISQRSDVAAHPAYGTYKVLYSFQGGNGDGSLPLIEDGLVAAHGLLYGATAEGGGTGCGYQCGTVFDATQFGGESLLYKFKGVPDSANPSGPLINIDGIWYGVTAGGGARNSGAVFAVDKRGHEHVVYSFRGSPDGATPFGGLIAMKGTLYGTTSYGGNHNLGTVFALTPSGSERILHSFKFGTDGEYPYAGLTELNGTFYGTTDAGGAYNVGTVFSITTSGQEKVVYSFKYGTDGAGPQTPLTALAGELYGTTGGGGGQNYLGTAFVVSITGRERVLHRFQRSLNDGQVPESPLLYFNGTLFGTTFFGGHHDLGVLYSLTTSGKERVIHNFKGTPDGRYPGGGLTTIGNTLYGMTNEGGTGPCYNHIGCGTIFELTL
jgi:uncharacterized repeat protein (TIGR03803 family)